MVIYMYLAILIVASIVTGVIVTIVEKKSLYPKNGKSNRQVDDSKKDSYLDDTDTCMFTLINMEPVKDKKEDTYMFTVVNMDPVIVEEEDKVEEVQETFDNPVVVSSYTVDLSGVINNIQKIEMKEDVEVLEETSTSLFEEIL